MAEDVKTPTEAENEAPANEGKGEDELLNEWMNMASGEGEDAEAEAPVDDKILDQNEIDSLLGVDDGDDNSQAGGVRVLVNNSIISYERLPLLEIVFDRFER